MSAQPPAPDQRHVHVQPGPLSSDLGIATFQADDQTLHYVALILAHPGGECVHLFDPPHWAQILQGGAARLQEIRARTSGLEIAGPEALRNLNGDKPWGGS